MWRILVYAKCIYSNRYSDFLVSEIDSEGNRVVLTDIASPTCDESVSFAHSMFNC